MINKKEVVKQDGTQRKEQLIATEKDQRRSHEWGQLWSGSKNEFKAIKVKEPDRRHKRSHGWKCPEVVTVLSWNTETKQGCVVEVKVGTGAWDLVRRRSALLLRGMEWSQSAIRNTEGCLSIVTLFIKEEDAGDSVKRRNKRSKSVLMVRRPQS